MPISKADDFYNWYVRWLPILLGIKFEATFVLVAGGWWQLGQEQVLYSAMMTGILCILTGIDRMKQIDLRLQLGDVEE
jgi:hypothetical protein